MKYIITDKFDISWISPNTTATFFDVYINDINEVIENEKECYSLINDESILEYVGDCDMSAIDKNNCNFKLDCDTTIFYISQSINENLDCLRINLREAIPVSVDDFEDGEFECPICRQFIMYQNIEEAEKECPKCHSKFNWDDAFDSFPCNEDYDNDFED